MSPIMVVEIPVWQNVAIGGNNNNQLKQETKVQSMDTACGEVLNNPNGGWETVTMSLKEDERLQAILSKSFHWHFPFL